MLGGASVLFLSKLRPKNFKSILTFSGGYLFAITIIHLLPELYSIHPGEGIYLGIFVLAGFYAQILLSSFSTGVEHGHIHIHIHVEEHHHTPSYGLFVALALHSVLEGALLVHPQAHAEHDQVRFLMIGVLLHKVPESIALMSILMHATQDVSKSGLLFLVYAFCSPMGLWASQWVSSGQYLHYEYFEYLFAFVAGNFLQISTTIFYESEKQGHKLSMRKILILILAALVAILAEFFAG